MDLKTAKKICEDFAEEHGQLFEENGECGFGRPCVGILTESTGNWVDFNPFDEKTHNILSEFYNEDFYPPENTPNAYHKHSCLAVLARGEDPDFDTATIELAYWLESIKSSCWISIVQHGKKETVESFFTGKNEYKPLYAIKPMTPTDIAKKRLTDLDRD